MDADNQMEQRLQLQILQEFGKFRTDNATLKEHLYSRMEQLRLEAKKDQSEILRELKEHRQETAAHQRLVSEQWGRTDERTKATAKEVASRRSTAVSFLVTITVLILAEIAKRVLFSGGP